MSNAKGSSINQSKDPSKPRLFSGFVSRIRTSSQSSQPNQDVITPISNVDCDRCKRLEESLITLNHDKFALEDEVNVRFLNNFFTLLVCHSFVCRLIVK